MTSKSILEKIQRALDEQDPEMARAVTEALPTIPKGVNVGISIPGKKKSLNGSKAGNFITHEGRVIFVGGPGSGGGGAGPAAAPAGGQQLGEAETATMAAMERAAAVEPEVTELLTGVADETGGRMEGLDFRLKGYESTLRKVKGEAEELGISETEAANGLTDLVRYTAVFDPDKLVNGANEIQSKLAEEGWTQYNHKWRNYFVSEGAYRGYNTVYTNANGQTFELQFHTPQSLEIKERVHALYEQARTLPQGAERNKLNQQMADMWSGFSNPSGHDTLPGVQMP